MTYYNTAVKRKPDSPYYFQGTLARLRGATKSDNPYGKYQDRFYTYIDQETCKQEWNRGWDDQDNKLYAQYAGLLAVGDKS